MKWFVWVVCGLGMVLCLPVGVASPLSWKIGLEGGAEYDTNFHILEKKLGTEKVDGAPLLRFGSNIALRWIPRPKLLVSANANGATKQFFSKSGRTENVFAAIVSNGYLVRWSKFIDTSLTARYYRIFGDKLLGVDGGNQKKFSSLEFAPGTRLHVADRSHFRIRFAFRRITYPPDRSLNWHGYQGHIGFFHSVVVDAPDQQSLDLPRSLDFSLSYSAETQHYRGEALENACPSEELEPTCIVPKNSSRRDIRQVASLGITYLGETIYTARYELQHIDSNSFGSSLLRHRGEVSFSANLPLDLLISLKGTLHYNIFLDPLLLARDVQNQDFFTLDAENRNGLIVHLAKDVRRNWTVEAKYAIYTNEFASNEIPFRRQLAYLGVLYRLENE